MTGFIIIVSMIILIIGVIFLFTREDKIFPPTERGLRKIYIFAEKEIGLKRAIYKLKKVRNDKKLIIKYIKCNDKINKRLTKDVLKHIQIIEECGDIKIGNWLMRLEEREAGGVEVYINDIVISVLKYYKYIEEIEIISIKRMKNRNGIRHRLYEKIR